MLSACDCSFFKDIEWEFLVKEYPHQMLTACYCLVGYVEKVTPLHNKNNSAHVILNWLGLWAGEDWMQT